MKRRSRWIILCAVLVVAGVGLIVLNQVVAPRRVHVKEQPHTEKEYYALFMEGKKVGHAIHTRDGLQQVVFPQFFVDVHDLLYRGIESGE